tara:strand:+ start:336 stop:527 length:192 start_codon:yes stop_codon:yes gene_type:complete
MSKKNKQKYPLQDRVLSSGLDELNIRLEMLINDYDFKVEMLELKIKHLKEMNEIYRTKGEYYQ